VKGNIAAAGLALSLAACGHDTFKYKTYAQGPRTEGSGTTTPAPATGETPTPAPGQPACGADIEFSRWAFLQNRSVGLRQTRVMPDGTVVTDELADGQQTDSASIDKLVGALGAAVGGILKLAVPGVRDDQGATAPRADEQATAKGCIPTVTAPGVSTGAR
jgi:hypothetical protein